MENMWAMEPTRDIPENPDPSRPVIAPTAVKVPEATNGFRGTILESATPRSFTIPWECFGSIFPKISPKAESPR
jgi:hypothetical protein